MDPRPWSFRLDDLRRFLEFACSVRAIASLRDHDGGNALILRHDIDIDPAAAVRTSEIEAALGIPATYCVMMTSDLYNAAGPVDRGIVRSLATAGFDVGLHFWPEAYGPLAPDELAARARDEARSLEDVIGVRVVSLSLHNPTAAGRYPTLAGFRAAYDPALFAPERYLSDSRMQVREDPYVFVQRTRENVAQLLIHPEHFTESGAGYAEIFAGVERRRAAIVDRYMSVNATYAAELPGGLFDSMELRARER